MTRAVAALVTVGGLLVWFGLARSLFVQGGEFWLARLGPAFAGELSLLRVGLWPWIAAVYLLQVVAAVRPDFSLWFTAGGTQDRQRALRWVAWITALAALLHVAAVVQWARAMAEARGLAVPDGPGVVAALILGSVGAALVVVAIQRWGCGAAVTLVLVFAVGLVAVRRLPLLLIVLASHPISTGLGLLCLALLTWLTLLFVTVTYDVPSGLVRRREGDGPEPLPVRLPMFLLGVVPLVLTAVTLKVARALCRGASAEFDLHGAFGNALFHLLDDGRLVTVVAGVVLVYLFSDVAFWLLYPSHRLEATLAGRSDPEELETLRGWLDGLIVQNAFYLCLVQLVVRLFPGVFDTLSLSPAAFVLVVGGLGTLRANLLERWAIELEHGRLEPLCVALGPLEAELVRARLRREGIHATLSGWTVPEVQPVTVPGMGELTVLVPARDLEQARAVTA